MTGEINDKLLEIVKYCSENQIKTSFTQYVSKKNSIEETIEMGEKIVQIQLGNKDDKNLLSLLSDFFNNFKE